MATVLSLNNSSGALTGLGVPTIFAAKSYGVDFTGDISKAATNLAGLMSAVAAAAANPNGAGAVYLHPGIVCIPNNGTWIIDGCHVIGSGGSGDYGSGVWSGNSPTTLIRHVTPDNSGSVEVVRLSIAHPHVDPEAEARGYWFKGVGIQGSMSPAFVLAFPNPSPGTLQSLQQQVPPFPPINGEHGLVVDNSRAFIEDVTIAGVGGHGIVVRDSVGSTFTSVSVVYCIGDGCHFDDNDTFGTPNGSPNMRAITDSIFAGCEFTGCGRDGVHVFSGPADLTFMNCDSENVQQYGIHFIGTAFRPGHENTFIGHWIERCGASVLFESGNGTNTVSLSFIGSAPSGGAYCNDVEISHGNDPALDGWVNGDTRPGGFANTIRELNANTSRTGTGVWPTERRAPNFRVYGMALPRLVFSSTGATNLDLMPLAGGIAEITLTGNTTYTFNTPRDGQVFIFAFTQGGAAHNYSVTWDARMDWLGAAPVIRATGAGVRSIVAFYYDLDANKFHELYRTPSSI